MGDIWEIITVTSFRRLNIGRFDEEFEKIKKKKKSKYL